MEIPPASQGEVSSDDTLTLGLQPPGLWEISCDVRPGWGVAQWQSLAQRARGPGWVPSTQGRTLLVLPSHGL